MSGDRRWTFGEWVRLTILAGMVRRDVDAELGDLIDRVAGGDDSAMPALHDRLNVIGRPELADRIRALLSDDTSERGGDP